MEKMNTVAIDLVRAFDLKELLERQQPPCVSIYMPTHKKSDQQKQDPIRLLNLLKTAQEELTRWGMRSSAAQELLSPVAGLVNSYSFWKYQSEGLAVFASPDTLKYYHLPYPFDELVTAGTHFHFKPLLPMISDNGLFFILAVSQHFVRLFQATRYHIGEISLEGLIPEEVHKMKLHHDLERHLDSHAKVPGHARAEGRPLNYFFGQGAHRECRKEDMLQFFNKVDWAVNGMLRQDHRPLVAAGDDYVVDIYRKANHYPYMFEKHVSGNQDISDEKQLQRMAWPLVEPAFHRSLADTKEVYKDLNGTMRVDNDLARVLFAAYDGLIQAVFVPLGKQQWGTLDGEKRKIMEHRAEEPGDQDLLDLAALHTLLHKGTVYAVKPEEMPGTGLINAIYRF